MASRTDNQTLYDLGRRYAGQVARRLAATPGEWAAVREVARAAGEGVAEVRTAYLFARAVDAVEAAAAGARGTILGGGNPHLTPAVVTVVSRRPGGRVRVAMERAGAGLHPFAPPPPAGIPADVAPWHYDLTRLRAAADLLDRVRAVVACPAHPLRADEVADLALHAAAVRVDADALRLVLGPSRGVGAGAVAAPAPTPGDRAGVVGLVVKARGLVEGVTGDLLRAAHTRSVAAARAGLARAIRDVSGAAAGIAGALPGPAAVPPPAVEAGPGGPSGAGGTYVIVYHAAAAGLVRLGRLGTFRLPAGYLLYVGSAFQGGGVAARTDRHLRGAGPRLWNADHLRGFARPVERWWTHHGGDVECAWAMALAAAPGYSCPAPRAGANDCKRCPAHLYHARGRPSAAGFARRLGSIGSGGYTLGQQGVAGAGP